MEKYLTGKIALITGGSRGVGAATAIAMAERGADVAINYVNSLEKANAIVEKLSALGVKGKAYQADLGDPDAPGRMVEQVQADFGSLDILVNNAGISTGGKIDDPKTDFEQADQFWNVNLWGMIRTTRAAAKLIRTNGRIIFVTSPLSIRAGFSGGADNAGAKGAIDSYARAVARDLGPKKITSNIVHLGLVKTDMSASYASYKDMVLSQSVFQRYAEMDEVTNVILFLSHPKTSYTTGSTVSVDGGYMA
jgi:NAD(P)-dependent dehydrogenase (short-subunit alcohol dehydrogenase family)